MFGGDIRLNVALGRVDFFRVHQQRELEQLLSLLRNSKSLTEEQLADVCIVMDDFRASLARVQPSAKREGFATVPDVTWDDIGALQDVREELTMAILVGLTQFKMFKNALDHNS